MSGRTFGGEGEGFTLQFADGSDPTHYVISVGSSDTYEVTRRSSSGEQREERAVPGGSTTWDGEWEVAGQGADAVFLSDKESFNGSNEGQTITISWQLTRLPDTDGDGLPDGQDSSNPPSETCGSLAIGGEDDRDDDGIPDGLDNCEETPNTDQEDGDRDGVGTECDELSISPSPRRCARRAHLTFTVHHPVRINDADPRPRTNGCWTYEHVAHHGGGWSFRRETREHWTTCGIDDRDPIFPLSPGWWSYEDLASEALGGHLPLIRKCARRAALAGDVQETRGYVHTAYRRRGCETQSCLRTPRWLTPDQQEKVRRVAGADAFFVQLYDGPDFPCPSFQPGCGSHPVLSERLFSIWNHARRSGRHRFGIGMIDVTPGWGASNSVIFDQMLRLCRASRADGDLPVRMLSLFSGKTLREGRLRPIIRAMNRCTA